MVLTLICLCVLHSVSAFSSVFPHQEIIDPIDPKRNNWTLVNIPKEKLFYVNNFNNTQTPLPFEGDITQCVKAKVRDKNEGHYHPPDISSVTFHSDGKTLNATIWLSSAFVDPPENADAWLSPAVKDAPWYQIRFGLSVAVHSSYDTEGTDYSLKYLWDALNENSTLSKKWVRTVTEASPEGDEKVIESIRINDDIFAANQQHKSYINLLL